MSAKALLKEARQALDQGEFQRSIELCEAVLKEDEHHYMALLILGAAGTADTGNDHSKKALAALTHAAEVKPDQDAPWQGLLRLCRKYPELNTETYLKALQRTLDLTPDEKDCLPLKLEKAEVGQDWELLDQCISEAANNASAIAQAAKVAKKILESGKKRNTKVLRKVAFADYGQDPIQEYLVTAYFESAASSSIQSDFAAISPKLNEAYLQRLAVEVFAKHGLAVVASDKLLAMFDAIENLSPEFALSKAKLCWTIKDYKKLEATCNQLLESDPKRFEVWSLLLAGYLASNRYRDVEMKCKEALKHFKKSHTAGLLAVLCKALVGQARFREALVIAEKAESLGAVRDTQIRFECLIETGKAKEALDEATKLNDKKWMLRARIALGGEVPAMDNSQLNEVGLATAAKYLLHAKRYNDALKVASAAISQNQSDTEMLTLLGEVYLESGHLENALRCLQQSFVLNRNQVSTCKLLSRTLRGLKRHAENRILLESVSLEGTIHDGNWWAFFNLGLHHLEAGDAPAAVVPLQKVASYCPSSLTFELLAEAYASRKSLAAAALCLRKSIEMGSDHEAVLLYRLACVTRDQEQHEEAIELFESSLKLDTKNPLCAHDLGQCCIDLARIRLREVLRSSAGHLLSKALAATTLPICEGHSNLISLWNLLGDVLLEAVENRLKIKAPADAKSRTLLGLSDVDQCLNDEQLKSLAEKCYLRCLSLNSNLPNVWHNLGLIYASRKSFDQSISCIKRSIGLDQSNVAAWNSLAVISVRAEQPLKLVQSAFIRALTLDAEFAPAWTNLGFLYLKNGLRKEANQCFTRAQAVDPLYVECWLGQATLAAMIGHFDAYDLYRHSNFVKPTIAGMISRLAMKGEAPPDLVDTAERTIDHVEGHDACSAAGFILLSHGLTVEAAKALAGCDCLQCKEMFAQMLARKGQLEWCLTTIEQLPDEKAKDIRAYVDFKQTKSLDGVVKLKPELAGFLGADRDLKQMRKELQRRVRDYPRSADNWRRLSECLLQDGQYEASFRTAQAMGTVYNREQLRVLAVSAMMAGRKREAYRAAASLVRHFPDRAEHWAVLRWCTLALEKRNLEVPFDEANNNESWNDFTQNLHTLHAVLMKGASSTFPATEPSKATDVCKGLIEQLNNAKFTKAFYEQVVLLLKNDPHSEASLFLLGLWAVSGKREDLYSRCVKGLPHQSALRTLLMKQHDSVDSQQPTSSQGDL